MSDNGIILVTTDNIPGRSITKVMGMARGNTIRARHMGKDIMAGFKNMVGGEIADYTKMMAESREQALDRLIEDAESLGADAVIGIRFTTTSLMQGAAEFLVYGTAVKLD
ncbi:MAG: YbjQ family protein [Spirochaetales bacterium]|uniref:UPF0145 protein PQJ61_05470 n=1 Tax=Candidatus Thalassospirochaeta sargassi TaxID=3119039 RepID=A0AAJ1IE93_9SPIO|nr:YbjQ family protein [Spirochaetales bacterium]